MSDGEAMLSEQGVAVEFLVGMFFGLGVGLIIGALAMLGVPKRGWWDR